MGGARISYVESTKKKFEPAKRARSRSSAAADLAPRWNNIPNIFELTKHAILWLMSEFTDHQVFFWKIKSKKKMMKVRFISELIANFILLFDEGHRKKNFDESQKEES